MNCKIPFCPNQNCHYHHVPEGSYTAFSPIGFYTTKIRGVIPRFICRGCGKTFSTQTFSLTYYLKKAGGFEAIESRLSNGESIRAIGRILGRSCASVSNRIGRMARNCTAMHEAITQTGHECESLAADGFESYCVSQYFPNNIHLLAGRVSDFVYRYDHAGMRRKGRMTKIQRSNRDLLDTKVRFPKKSIEKSFGRVIDEVTKIFPYYDKMNPIELWTDEKKEYWRALTKGTGYAANEHKKGFIQYRTISSKAARTKNNPLWVVNYLDREIRKDLKEHVRETVCWGRNVNNQMERMTVYLWQHNYKKAFRINGTENQYKSHAEHAGYEEKLIKASVKSIWENRAIYTREDYGELATLTWKRMRMTPLKENKEYLPYRVTS
jgi:transposase-like protein